MLEFCGQLCGHVVLGKEEMQFVGPCAYSQGYNVTPISQSTLFTLSMLTFKTKPSGVYK